MANPCYRKREGSADSDASRRVRKGERIFTPAQAQRSFSLAMLDGFSFVGLYVPYFLGVALLLAIALLLPPLPIPHTPTSVADVMLAAEDVMEAALSAPARASGLADELWQMYTQLMSTGSHIWHRWYAYAIIVFCVYYMLSARPPVYIMDFAVYEAPEEWRVSREDLKEIMRRLGVYTEDSLTFMGKLLAKSGTGEATHWPPGTIRVIKDIDPATGKLYTSADRSIEAARKVAETILCSVFEEACKRSGKKPREVDFLIINCSLFCPTPSLCSIVAKRFNLKPTCRTFNLGGMGCSASLISLDLAKELLEGNPNSIAVVLSTEEISQQLYMGNERGHLMQNTLFRVGGSGVLLSNRPVDGFRAKYKVLHTVRVADNSETAHGVVYQCNDSLGQQGIFLGKEIIKVAGKALQANLTNLGPAVLPVRELLTFFFVHAARTLIKRVNAFGDAMGWESLPFTTGKAKLGVSLEVGVDGSLSSPSPSPSPSPRPGSTEGGISASSSSSRSSGNTNTTTSSSSSSSSSTTLNATPGRYTVPNLYVPDFKRGVQHFCIHAGGRAVIDGIQENLKLERWRTAPSRATLYHWGNTSSSSVWYELRYCEGENDRVPPSPPGAYVVPTATAAPAAPAPAAVGEGASKRSATPSRRSRSRGAGGGKKGEVVAAPAPAPAPPAPTTPSKGGAPSDEVDPDAEAALNGWETDKKWKLPEYRGRQVRRGDRVLQLAFGSGFKANSSLLLALRGQ